VKVGVAAELVEHMGSGEVRVCVVAEEARKCPLAVVHTAVEVAVVRAMCIDSEEVVGRDFGEVVVGQVERPVAM
jgi:hypothetical protein